MKKYLFITLITITIFATVTTSCSDDFVDRPVQYSIDSENYFNSKQTMKMLYSDLWFTEFVYKCIDGRASDNTFAGGIAQQML
jgi:hypothetical protein